MRKYLLLLIFCLLLGLTACGKNSIVGEWEVDYLYSSGTKNDLKNLGLKDSDVKIVFEKNNQGTIKIKGHSEKYDFEWEKEKDILHLIIEEQDYYAKIKNGKIFYYYDENNLNSYIVLEKVE